MKLSERRAASRSVDLLAYGLSFERESCGEKGKAELRSYEAPDLYRRSSPSFALMLRLLMPTERGFLRAKPGAELLLGLQRPSGMRKCQ